MSRTVVWQVHDVLQWYFCEGSDCGSRVWLQEHEQNEESFCSKIACPRGYPWQHYPEKVHSAYTDSYM